MFQYDSQVLQTGPPAFQVFKTTPDGLPTFLHFLSYFQHFAIFPYLPPICAFNHSH